MPGANYMGGRRNAAKAKVKDATGRLEKTFFNQRRLCALSKGLSASKPTQRQNGPLEESLRLADISLSHARRKIQPKTDAFTSSFAPSPIHISPCTPRSRRHIRKTLEAPSSSSDISRPAVLDALDVSEPMFLRGVLDRILTLPDLAGISRNQTKPTVAKGRQPQSSDESSPLQRTKRKRSPSDWYRESDSLSNERPFSSSRYGPSYAYENICPKPTVATESLPQASDESNTMQRSKRKQSPSDLYEGSDSLSNERPSSPSRYMQSYIYENICAPPQKKYANWNQSHTCLPTSIIFRGLKAKRSTVTDTYPVEEPTIYGTLFEQDDPWDAIGQILGLSNMEPSKILGNVINELNESEASQETNSAVVEREERDEELMSVGPDEILQVQYHSPLERQLIEKRASSRCDSLEEFNRSQDFGNARAESPELAYVGKDVEELAQRYEEDPGCLLRDIEDKRLMPLSQDLLEAPDRIKTGVGELECSERGSREEPISNGEYNSVLAIPELQELDGLFMGPSLFDDLEEEDDEI